VTHEPPRLRQRRAQAVWSLPGPLRRPGGVTRTRTFDTRTEASQHLAEVRADLKRGQWHDPTLARRPLSEYAREWLDSRVDLKPTTRQAYAATLRRHVLPPLGGYRLEELTSALIRSWYAGLARSSSPTPTRQAYALLRTILNTDATALCRLRPVGGLRVVGRLC
jgi:hypothetical protein